MLAAAALLWLATTACAPNDNPDEPALLVGVAASIQPVAAELAERFEAEQGIPVTLVTGASGTLAEQLRQGAPLDVIVSADTRHTSALTAEGLLDPTSIAVLATGELVAITNLDVSADNIASLLRSDALQHVAIANPDIAPYGEAARRYLEDIGIWNDVAGLVAYGENVAHAFQFVASGNAEVGFVPRSLLIASDSREVRGLAPLPLSASASLQVTAGVNTESQSAEAARRFVGMMSDTQAAKTWERFGYVPDIGKVVGAE